MADDQFQQASGNWWDSARNMRFESGSSQSSSVITNIGDHHFAFHDTQKQLQPTDSDTFLGLSSQAIDWNQASLLQGEKGRENSNFRSMLQENLSTTRNNFQQESEMGLSQVQWRSEKLFPSESSSNEFKQVNRGFCLDQNQFSPHEYSSGDSNVTSQGIASTFHIDSSSSTLYGLQGLLPDNNNQVNQPQQGSSFPNYSANYGLNTSNNIELMNSWSNKVPQFLRNSPPKQQQPNNNQLHFTNNAPFWNASESASSIKDARSSFFPSLQPSFDHHVQSKNISEVRESGGGVVKKSGGEPAAKRQRNETPSPLPAFKVRKEKMGDRITALQQLVSPFGKTDTASVLSEAIEYIKFLHEQVTVLSTPYMKSGAPTQIQQQISGKSKEGEGPKQDLKSRGLCLVSVSSTFPVTHETTVDFWTPTFGGTSR